MTYSESNNFSDIQEGDDTNEIGNSNRKRKCAFKELYVNKEDLDY